MIDKLRKAPKTSISTMIGAILIYCLWKWYIWQAEAELISQLLVCLWVIINYLTKK